MLLTCQVAGQAMAVQQHSAATSPIYARLSPIEFTGLTCLNDLH
jgi:hypothetical protein